MHEDAMPAGPLNRAGGQRLPWGLAAGGLLALFTFVASWQEGHLDPTDPPRPLTWAWFARPIEINGHRRLLGVDVDLNAVCAVPGTGKAWAVGDGGLILHTVDGGRTWARQVKFQWNDAAAVEDPTKKDASQYESQEKKSAALATPPWSVFTGLLAAPPPATQKAQTQGDLVFDAAITAFSARLRAVQFFDEQHGWVGSETGVLLMTSNGGTTWRVRRENMSPIAAVWMQSPDAGLIIGQDGYAVRVKDGSLPSQTPIEVGARQLTDFQALSAQVAVCLNRDGSTSVTLDGGTRWQLRTDTPGNVTEAVSCFFTSPERGWMGMSTGELWFTQDADRRWDLLGAISDRPQKDIALDGDRSGIAVTDGDAVITADAGQRWARWAVPGRPALSAVCYLSPDRAVAIGNRGAIYTVSDEGRTWRRRSTMIRADDAERQYWRFPAPWYYLSLIPVGLLLAPALRPRRPLEVDEPSVADVLISDKPLEPGDPDPLEFGRVARSVSAFLRNVNTRPPLTLAITGAWGTGKSSLMNLVRADLSKNRFRSVWFNPWHHQKEEHLLAALLENIKLQAIPPWLSRAGARFRTRLLWIRWRKYWPVMLAALLLAAAAWGFMFVAPPLTDVPSSWSELFRTPTESLARFAPGLTSLVVSIGSVWYLLRKGLKAFGVAPAQLAGSISQSMSVSEREAQVSFRYRFKEQFEDVTAALRPLDMVIFIDDLDRCAPRSVLEVLESINFLTTCGDCFFVLGMDPHVVEPAVGLAFKDIAEETLGKEQDGDGDAVKAEGRHVRRRFAQNYVEKLVQMTVSLPIVTERKSAELLVSSEPPPEPSRSQYFVQEVTKLASRLGPIVAVLLLAFAAAWFGGAAGRWTQQSSSTSIGVSQTGEQRFADGDKGPQETGRAVATLTEPVALSGGDGAPASDRAPAANVIPRWVYIAVLATLVGGIAWVFWLEVGSTTRDSPEFTEALRTWAPVIFAAHRTPRSIKRFINHVRYLAMRQRPTVPEEPGAWHRWSDFIARFRKRDQEQQQSLVVGEGRHIPEDLLVGLAAWRAFRDEAVKTDAPLAEKLERVAARKNTPGELKTAIRQQTADLLSRREDFERLMGTAELH